MTERVIEIWKPLAVTLIGCMAGWWSRQLTLEVPPEWFRQDVLENTRRLERLDAELRQFENDITKNFVRKDELK